MANAPDEVTVEVIASGGQTPVIGAMVFYAGNERDAERVLRPLYSFGPPLADGIRKQNYGQTGAMAPNLIQFFAPANIDIAGEEKEPGLYWQGGSVSSLSDLVIINIADSIKSGPKEWTFGLGHIMRSAVARIESGSTSLNRPLNSTTVHFDIAWSHKSQSMHRMNWVDDSISALSVSPSEHDYINYMSSDNPKRIKAAYGDNFERLVTIKRRYDPENILSRNRNSSPSCSDPGFSQVLTNYRSVEFKVI